MIREIIAAAAFIQELTRAAGAGLTQNVDSCQEISLSTTKKWGFGNGIANYYAEIALHFGKLIATI